jgi:hypothetical protein
MYNLKYKSEFSLQDQKQKTLFSKNKKFAFSNFRIYIASYGQNLVPQNVPIVINNSLGMWAIYFHAFVVENCLWTHP